MVKKLNYISSTLLSFKVNDRFDYLERQTLIIMTGPKTQTKRKKINICLISICPLVVSRKKKKKSESQTLREALKFNVSEREEEREGHYKEPHVLRFVKTIHKNWN